MKEKLKAFWGKIKDFFSKLGKNGSHGCVRLSVEDAKWIYQNCPVQTKIIVY